MTERMIDADGALLCTEAFGDPADPPVLLVMGVGASMLWWEDDFCAGLAAGGRFVIRYDHRDTGRSTSDPPGHPTYSGDDLVADAARVLDGYGIARAHVVGVSMGGALAQLLALDFAGRVASLVLMSTSPAGPAPDLPPPTDAYRAFAAEAPADPVAEVRVLNGDRPFDEARVRSLVARDITRARNPESAQNHMLLEGGEPWRHRLGAIAVPTLVVHGSADPLFPLGHGRALADEIPGAGLLVLDGAGHVLDPADHETVVRAILEHTTQASIDRASARGAQSR
jgi:pimeloyl-ACP methyl ester carboxylesterase